MEVTIALTVLAIATLGSVSMIVSGVSLDADNREAAAASDVMRRLLEELHEVPFEEVFARFNADPADDPGGSGTALGDTFTVETNRKEDLLQLNVTSMTNTSMAYRTRPLDVRISFPVDAMGKLSETVMGSAWSSRTWDLDGNGQVTVGDISASYRVLPVRIQVTWTGTGGTRAIEHVRLLTRRDRLGAEE